MKHASPDAESTGRDEEGAKDCRSSSCILSARGGLAVEPNRGIRVVLWIPVRPVLPVFLFLPEIWGIYSHLSQPRSGNLAGYRVPIPSSWIVLDRDHQKANGKSWVTGMTGRGIGFGPKPYLQEDWLSSWEIRTE